MIRGQLSFPSFECIFFMVPASSGSEASASTSVLFCFLLSRCRPFLFWRPDLDGDRRGAGKLELEAVTFQLVNLPISVATAHPSRISYVGL